MVLRQKMRAPILAKSHHSTEQSWLSTQLGARLPHSEQSGFLGVFLTKDALKTSFDDFCLSFVGVFSFPHEMKPTGKVGMCECGYDS